MREPDNIREVATTGIDWMGFIFYARSPRFIGNESDEETARIEAIRESSLRTVGVFVNATSEYMQEMAQKYTLDYLQLHGNESPEACYELQKRGYAVIKAFSIASEEDLAATVGYEGRVDYFLFDTKCNNYGGSGKQFNWSVLAAYTGQTPFLLSGGIQPESVEAIRNFRHPRFAGIDLNSGFETEPGVKNARQLKTFIEKIKKQ